jgi:Secretion system C-terminal sorting domain
VNWPTIPGGNWANVETFGASFSKPFMLRPQFGKIAGDDVCDAIILSTGSNGPFRHDLATTQVGEVLPPTTGGAGGASNQTAWYSDGTGITNTMWFKFVATTKKVRILSNWNGEALNDTQLGLWKANTGACGDLLSASTATLLAANDDSSTTYYGSVITGSTICLTPGATYYVQVDAYKSTLASAMGDSLYVVFQPVADITPAITALNPAYCVGAPSVTLTGTPAGGGFTVNNTPSSIYTPATVGADTVKYSIANCYIAKQVVTVNAYPTVNLGGNQSSCNPSITLNAGNPGSTYVWSNSATTQTITVNTSGNYSVTVTNAAGCPKSDSATVTLNSTLVANLTPNISSVCEGTSAITLVGTPAGGSFSSNATSGSFNPTTAGTYTASYIVSNVCGTDTADATITVNANPVASLTAPVSVLCTGTPATLTGLPVGGVYSVVSGSSSALSGNTFNASNTGNYTIAYTFTNAATCSDSAQFNFNVNCILGLDQNIINNSSFTIAPNPNNGVFTISSTNEIDGSIELINELGQVVYKNRMNGLSQTLNVSDLSTGVYYVKVISDKTIQTKRLSIIK